MCTRPKPSGTELWKTLKSSSSSSALPSRSHLLLAHSPLPRSSSSGYRLSISALTSMAESSPQAPKGAQAVNMAELFLSLPREVPASHVFH